MKPLRIIVLLMCCLVLSSCKNNTKPAETQTQEKLKALIIDGENNHGIWPKSTFMMKDYLEQTGLFDVDIARKQYNWVGPHHNVKGLDSIEQLLELYPFDDGVKRTSLDSTRFDPKFNPDFSKYDVVVNNLGWKSSHWPEQTKKNFVNFIKGGGGLIIVHAASNAWGDWDDYNKMIGLGAWGGRTEKSGPYVFYNSENKIEYDTSKGNCGQHGKQSEFVITTRAPEHPIMKGLPNDWLHAKDELYEKLRGPAENMTILATAYSDKKNGEKRTGRHEPMLMAIDYHKGRIFHTTLGHMDYSMECVGFITTLQRGAEWAATGKVTQSIPKDFPNTIKSSSRTWNRSK